MHGKALPSTSVHIMHVHYTCIQIGSLLKLHTRVRHSLYIVDAALKSSYSQIVATQMRL